MASITSMMNSSYNTSSIYGTRNVLSGLASGMDTETMIENAVSGIKRKIQSLYQKRTRVEWQQEAYRSIIDKAVNLNTKYTSYSSKTNLLSSSFFTNSVITTALGTYADKVSAIGKTTSDIKINAVKQLASAASYTVSGSAAFGTDLSGITGSKRVDLSAYMDVSRISGSLTLQYGGSNGTSFSLDFDELDIYDNAGDLADAIREKLGEQTWTYTRNGIQETVTGSDVVDVQVDGSGNITFADRTSDGNSVYISSASGNIKKTLNVSTGSGQDTLKVGAVSLSESVSTREYLSGKDLTVSLNGTSKTIKMSEILYEIGDGGNASHMVKTVQGLLDEGFGANKIKVDLNEDGVMSFRAVDDGSTLSIGGSAVKALGFEDGDSNYVNTNKTLGDLFGDAFAWERHRLSVKKDGKDAYDFVINGAHISVTKDTTLEELMKSINSNADAGVKVSYSKLTNEFKFTANETGANSRIEMGGMADAIFGASYSRSSDDFAIKFDIDLGESGSKYVNIVTDDGAEYGFTLTRGMTMEDAVREANNVLAAGGATASYNELSGGIVITNSNGKTLDYKLTVGNDALDENVKEVKYTPSARYTTGTDAIMDVEINGKRFENMFRSSNSFDLDGLNVTVKGAFNEDGLGVDKDGKEIEPITFNTVTDSDTIIEAIRNFVNDYNEMITELKNAYSTQPLTDSKKNRYDPLTAEEEEKYTESELAAYNEKAKQGILFGDTTLSSMYSKLLGAIAPGGVDGQTLREIGIGTSYENGLTTISLDEDKLRAALESDPDKVKNAFTKTVGNGSSTDGLMQTMQNTLNTYVKTTGEPKGVLITKAGSIKAPTSLNNNSLNTQIGNIDKEIQRWQDKMASQIDRYTIQFSRLEQLIAAMNSQASALSGLMGGAEGYY